MPQLPWTDQDTELLRSLWTQGITATRIAAKFSGKFSRSSVLGKANRLGLEFRGNKVNREYHHRTKPSMGIPKPKATKPPQTQTPASEAPVPCGEPGIFPSDGCQFIAGPYSPDFVMCGHPLVRGKWCSYHAGICYAPKYAAR